jgi:ethanolamine permease
LAVAELLLFVGITLPHFKLSNLSHNALPSGWTGIFAAIPFAIWFFLGIEGLANVAEETSNPQKNILKGFGSSILTLVILCVLVLVSAVGVAGWEAIVFDAQGHVSDSPLPLAMAKIVGKDSLLFHLLLTVGLFGLLASFHGLMLAGGRTTYEFAKFGYAPASIAVLNPRSKTPANALIINAVFGILILLTGQTTEIITIAVFGALTLYGIAMVCVLVLRQKEPSMPRPFRVPFYPILPIIALALASISILAMAYYNFQLVLIYLAILLGTFMIFKTLQKS